MHFVIILVILCTKAYFVLFVFHITLQNSQICIGHFMDSVFLKQNLFEGQRPWIICNCIHKISNTLHCMQQVCGKSPWVSRSLPTFLLSSSMFQVCNFQTILSLVTKAQNYEICTGLLCLMSIRIKTWTIVADTCEIFKMG